MPNVRVDAHFDERDIAAFVDGTAGRHERASMDAHLSICPACRAEVVDVARIVRTAPGIGGWLQRVLRRPRA